MGRCQWATLIVLYCCIDSINVLLYNMSYLELIPEEYYCVYEDTSPGQEFICSAKDFCEDPKIVSYRPN